MREETARVRELLQSGKDVEGTIEQLIVDGYFGDTKDIRKHLTPVVREIQMQMNNIQSTKSP